MDRAEKIGLGVATAGHVLLFGLLSAGFLATSKPLKLNSPPMDVSLVDEVALKSAAPLVSNAPPPPSVAPEKGPTQDAKPAPEPEPEPAPTPVPPKPLPPKPRPLPPEKPATKPAPQPKPAPPKKDVPKAAPKPKAAPEKPAPAKARHAAEKPKAAAAPAAASKTPAKFKTNAPARASGAGKADKPKGSLLGKDFLKGIDTNSDSPRKPAPPPAAEMGPQQKAALDAEIRRQLKPHWKAPTGADADSLRTILRVQLDRNGELLGSPQVIDQTGITPSNKSQASLHAEQAIRAVKLASPFKLPPQFYEQWKDLKLGFDRRLSQ